MEKTVKQQGSFKVKIQKLGSRLSSMIMPNIGALIAWGVLTALFIPDGYLPNKAFASMVGPMLMYLIPLLIGYTGGKVVAGDRGAVVGAIATMGVIVGTEIPMMLGAMIMGPLGGFIMKKFDFYFQKRIPSGFEMLVNNFSAGLIGFALALLGFQAIGPIVDMLTKMMASGVETILNTHLLPLTSIFIEPAKILFLNNAINHGILTPLGTEQALTAGKSVLFLLEANPGPGLGVLLAFMLFGRGSAKSSAPGAILIQFLGGIHEIYFPYVMMKPILFLSVIAGGMSGSFIFQLLDAGLRAPASPGSIIAIMAMTPVGNYLPVLAGILVATVVSFAIAAVILKADVKEEVEDHFNQAVKETQRAKAASKGFATAKTMTGIQQIIFACDAGMGSSAMGASILRKKIQAAGLSQEVTNCAIANLSDRSDTLIVTQVELQDRAKQKAPSATFVAVENFLNSPKYDEIIDQLSGIQPKEENSDKEKSDFFTIRELKGIKEVVFVHDQRVGSTTMGMKVLEEILLKKNLQVTIKRVFIDELTDKEHTLVISKEELKDSVKRKVSQGKYMFVSNMVSPQKYEGLATLFEKIA